MILRRLRGLRNSSVFSWLLLLFILVSVGMTSFHLTLYLIEESFLSIRFKPEDVGRVANISEILKDFQDDVSECGGEISSDYKPHSGLPFLGFSEIMDFALFRIYDCGHSVALFNRVAKFHGVDCGPITTFGPGGAHVISTCEVQGRNVFVDPFFNYVYRMPDGTYATQDQIVSNWDYCVRSSENAGIRAYPVESFRIRNPKFILNRLVDFGSQQGLDALELFSFRRMIGSTHLFLAQVSGILGLFSLLLLLWIKI